MMMILGQRVGFGGGREFSQKLHLNSRALLNITGPFRGSHMMRDLPDVAYLEDCTILLLT